MPKITLLKTRTIEYRDNDHLKGLIRHHQQELGKRVMMLDDSGTLAAIQAIAYNFVHLTRELEKRNGKKAELHVLPGGKKD
jgi:hypothetical protein